MSNEKHETVADIVAMLRANARGDRFDDFSFTSLADRIEAAAKRYCSDCFRFRNALLPVLLVDPSYEDGTPIQLCDGEVSTDSDHGVSVNGRPIDDHTLANCLAAVRESQRIYNGGEERL